MTDLPDDLQPIDDENHLQSRLNFWNKELDRAKGILKTAEDHVSNCKSKVKFYEKVIRSYNKSNTKK